MFKSLKELLAHQTREVPAAKSKATALKTVNNYRAVSVVPGMRCCQDAKVSVRIPHLLRDAPRLPLPNCTMPTSCACRFKKVPDRRDGDRRMFADSETGRWFSGQEQRARRDRRTQKK
jgi:hypothetical protein